ncbi:hypothetical protein BDR04DRAFT_410243 [Suillus decipiens]|nr:hypothetical protein BDR04DRAFT_410243 [Suillus decipiens]
MSEQDVVAGLRWNNNASVVIITLILFLLLYKEVNCGHSRLFCRSSIYHRNKWVPVLRTRRLMTRSRQLRLQTSTRDYVSSHLLLAVRDTLMNPQQLRATCSVAPCGTLSICSRR